MASFTGTGSAEILPSLLLGPVQAIGSDVVDAGGGNDIAIGWSGDDVIRGGAGADVIVGGLLNAAGVVTLSGIDAADYTTSAAGVTVDLSVVLDLTLPISASTSSSPAPPGASAATPRATIWSASSTCAARTPPATPSPASKISSVRRSTTA